MQKRSLEKALIVLATELASKGFTAEAAQVDAIVNKVAATIPVRRTGPRPANNGDVPTATPAPEAPKFSIDVTYTIAVSAAEHQKAMGGFYDPPAAAHKSVTAVLSVNPVDANDVELQEDARFRKFDKVIKARNLPAAKLAIEPFLAQVKAKFAPARSREQMKFVVG